MSHELQELLKQLASFGIGGVLAGLTFYYSRKDNADMNAKWRESFAEANREWRSAMQAAGQQWEDALTKHSDRYEHLAAGRAQERQILIDVVRENATALQRNTSVMESAIQQLRQRS